MSLRNISIVLCLYFVSFQLLGQDVVDKKIVYIINSQDQLSESMKPAFENQVKVIRDEYPFSEFFFYYLDNDRTNESKYDLVHNALLVDLEENTPDLVIVNGYDAYFYVMDRQEIMFKDVPIVFSGITDLWGRISEIPEGVTGIPDILDVDSNIKVALQLQPYTENLYIILDRRVSNRTIPPTYLQKAIDYYSKSLNIIIIKNPEIDELAEILENADDNSVALMYPIILNSSLNSENNPYVKITKQKNVPIYSFYEFSMNIGIVGGYISSTSTYGRLSGEYAVKVLNGVDPSDIPIPEHGFQDLVLDYKILKRYDIPIKNVPENAILINSPHEFYSNNKRVLEIAGIVFIALLSIIVILIISLLWRRRIQGEIVKLKCYLSNIINSMPSIIVGVDRNNKVLLWNDSAEKKTGIRGDIAIGKLFTEVLPGYEDEINKINTVIADKITLKETYREMGNDTTTLYENITLFPLIANGVEGAVLRIDNVTKEKKQQEKLNHTSRMDSLGELSAGIAHDFNNMLGGITGLVQLLLLKEKSLSVKGVKMLEMVLSSAFKSAELTKKLLAFSRTKKIESTSVDINSILDDTVSILERAIDKRVSIVCKKNAEESILIGDNSSLQNTLMNLGINASHAMAGNGELTFTTENVQLGRSFCNRSDFDIKPGKFIVVKVQDTGCGIANENISKIFEPFFTTKSEEKGTGLGLSTVYGTIKDHHGAIDVDTRIGQGTIFSIYLPCNSSHTGREDDHDYIRRSDATLLLADDDNIMLISGEYILKNLGYNVITARNGKEAVDLYRNNNIDIVIMDMIMPVMSGRDAFYKMKDIDPQCKVVITSGFSTAESLKELEDSGLSGFISKPFRLQSLSKLLDDIISMNEN